MATMLGRLLVDEGAVSAAEVEGALDEQRETRERLGAILVRRGTDPEAVARALATQLRLRYAPPPLRPEPAALALVPRPLALRLGVVPLVVTDRALRVALSDPLDAGAIDDLQFHTGRRAEPVVATDAAIAAAQAEAYGDAAVRHVLDRLKPDNNGGAARARGDAVDVLRHASEAPPIVALVDLLVERAVGAGASDVHIEQCGDALAVRARVDGVLRPLHELPPGSGAAVVSRIKIMAGLDIAVKRQPQDGRSAAVVRGRRVELRVSTLPAVEGEKVVIRLLEAGAGAGPAPTSSSGSPASLGLGPELAVRLEATLHREHGLFLVTGPTGSGKTTTLYAILESRDRVGRNILSLEDPVERRIAGVTQVQVRPRAGLTFATALRSVLRQDPDVIMVGEMRDRETAEVGLAAALTGHLVLSTLHTIDAPGAVGRLVEMGAARYLVAGGLIGVLAQRLVRRLCGHCRTVAPAAGEDLYEIGLPAPTHLPRAVGCGRCGGSGFRGRIGLFELLVVDAAVREQILAGAPVDAVREAAGAGGMRPLPLDAWARVEAGLTTLEEVRPFLTMLSDAAPSCRSCRAPLGSGRRFCPLCGDGVVRRCACGAEARPHWRFCGSCGARLSAVERVRDLTE
jgi:type IV pilus assembly protein PilB